MAYWICDDGYFHKKYKYVILATNAYKIEEVNLLLEVLTNKFQLICYALKDNNENYVIRISSKSLLNLQNLLKNVIPNSMKYKIGL